MLEEHRIEQVGHHADNIPRRVESPAMSAQVSGSMSQSAPSSRIMEPQRHTASPAQHAGQQYRPHVEELFNQLQSQLHVHSNILEEQRHHIERLDGAVSRLQQDQHYILSAVHDVKADLAARAPSHAADAPDANEIEILMEQVQRVAKQANEVDGLKMELSIMKRQMRRVEQRHGSPAPSGLSTAEPMHDHAHPPPHHAQPLQAQHSTSTPSAAPEPRSVLYQTPSETRLAPPILSNPELRDSHAPAEARTLPGFRSIDPASSTSTVSGWRPAGGYAQGPPGIAPPSGAPTSTPQSETPAASGWAAVNANSAPKRNVPVDGHAAAYESSQPGSPKRQRLAPLMPRVSYDQTSTAASSPYQGSEATPNSLPPVPSLANSRNPSNESAGSLPPPANPLRFVLSNQEAQAEESWRSEAQRPALEAARSGRSSPRRGRGGLRARSRKSGGPEEHGTPEYEHPEWSGSQMAQNGYYPPGALHPQDQAAVAAARGNLVRRGGHGVAPADHQVVGHPPGMPVSEVAQQQVPQASLYPDPHFMPITTTADVAASAAQSSSNPNTPGQPTKKTRTKPIRNADGVLIRKDGRPDMRSVSSAMNLKKVHAKKEAERQSKEASEDGKDGRNGGVDGTPRSASEHDHDGDGGSPNTPSHHRGHDRGHYSEDEGDESDEEEEKEITPHSQHDKHAANMRKIFPYGIDGGPQGSRNMAQAFFTAGADGRAPPEVKIEALPPRGMDRDKAMPSRENGRHAAAEGAGERVTDGVGVGPAAPTPASAKDERRDVEMTEASAEDGA